MTDLITKKIEDCVLRFREGRPEYIIEIDHDKASLSMLTSADITNFFRNAIFGPVITKFIDNEREVDVRVRFTENLRDSIDKIMNLSIKNNNGDIVPVKMITNLKEDIGPTKIWRHNGRRCVSITAQIGNLSYDDSVKEIEKVLSTLNDREAEIIRLRFGIGYGYPLTLEDVGKIFKITRERVRQIEAKAIRKMKHPSRCKSLIDYLE